MAYVVVECGDRATDRQGRRERKNEWVREGTTYYAARSTEGDAPFGYAVHVLGYSYIFAITMMSMRSRALAAIEHWMGDGPG